MVAVATQILYQKDFKAGKELQIMVGSDRVVRVNVDGVCAIRVRCLKDAKIVIEDLAALSNDGKGL